jgi:DNA polymerase-4
MSLFAHFDADAFFASVEQAADRRLRQRPVAVGGSTRGVVCSASYEARAYGIHSAMPTRKALQLCPDLVLIKGQFELYERFSDQLFFLCEDISPHVEQTSIDEGYLDFRGRDGGPEGAVQALRGFDKEVCQWLKITVSCGLSARKRVSQIAGKARKPHGFTVVPEGNEAAFLAPLPLRHLPGLGPVSTERLGRLGLERVGDLIRVGPERLYPVLGRRVEGILQLARGEDDTTLAVERAPARSLSGQETLAAECGDEAMAIRLLKSLLQLQLARLRASRQTARILGISLRYTDREEASASEALLSPSNLDPVFFPLVGPLLRRAWRRRVRINQVRLTLRQLYPDCIQEDLFGAGQGRLRQICTLGDQLNATYGEGTLVRASQLEQGD